MRARPLAAPVAAPAGDLVAEDYLPGQSPPLGDKRCVSRLTTLFRTLPEFLSRGQHFVFVSTLKARPRFFFSAVLCSTLKARPKFLFLRSFRLASQTGSVLNQTSSAGTSGTGDQGSGKVQGGEGKAAAAAAAAAGE